MIINYYRTGIIFGILFGSCDCLVIHHLIEDLASDSQVHWHVPAAFGPNSSIFRERLVASVPADACSSIVNEAELSGNIALVTRGGCSFTSKVYQAQISGAIAVIVADLSSSVDWTLIMSGSEKDSALIRIPSIFVSHSTAKFLKDQLAYESRKNNISSYKNSLITLVDAAFDRARDLLSNIRNPEFIKIKSIPFLPNMRENLHPKPVALRYLRVSIDTRGAIIPNVPQKSNFFRPVEAFFVYFFGSIALLAFSAAFGVLGMYILSRQTVLLRERALRKFKTLTFSKSNQRQLGTANRDCELRGDQDLCAVCLEDFVDGQTLTILPCRHIFHGHCVRPWLLKGGQCPMCKNDVFESTESTFSRVQIRVPDWVWPFLWEPNKFTFLLLTFVFVLAVNIPL